jgi:hypothetical protein
MKKIILTTLQLAFDLALVLVFFTAGLDQFRVEDAGIENYIFGGVLVLLSLRTRTTHINKGMAFFMLLSAACVICYQALHIDTIYPLLLSVFALFAGFSVEAHQTKARYFRYPLLDFSIANPPGWTMKTFPVYKSHALLKKVLLRKKEAVELVELHGTGADVYVFITPLTDLNGIALEGTDEIMNSETFMAEVYRNRTFQNVRDMEVLQDITPIANDKFGDNAATMRVSYFQQSSDTLAKVEEQRVFLVKGDYHYLIIAKYIMATDALRYVLESINFNDITLTK